MLPNTTRTTTPTVRPPVITRPVERVRRMPRPTSQRIDGSIARAMNHDSTRIMMTFVSSPSERHAKIARNTATALMSSARGSHLGG